jgi:protein SCO1/2
MSRQILILSLAALAFLSGVALWSWRGPGVTAPAPAQHGAATLLPGPRAIPDFHLTDHREQGFGPAQLRGQWSLLFFGFTRCPDICPNTLGLLHAVNAELKRAGGTDALRVVFISVDPAHDSPAALKNYVEYFDPAFIAVTGAEPELRKLTDALYVPFTYVPAGKDGDYTVEHSGALVLLNPRGQAVAYFSPPLQAGPIARDLRALLKG